MNFSSENIENENSSSTFLSIEQSKEAETTTKRTLLTSNTHDEPSNTICGLCNKEPGKKQRDGLNVMSATNGFLCRCQ